MPGRLPDFIVIGAMKCGTSMVHEQLARRPGIFMSEPKEPNFFSDDAQYRRGLDWYTGLFGGAAPGQICGESSTHYTKLPTHPETVPRLRDALPEVRFVYVMRDPVQRIVSQYIHEWTQREVRGSLAAAVERNPRYAAYSCYARQLEPYLGAYGPDAVLPVFFERLFADPQAEFERICRFLGDPSPEPPVWRRALPAKNVSSERMRRSAVRDGLLALSPVRRLLRCLPQGTRETLKGVWRMGVRPQLPPEVRAGLVSRIDEDLVRLGGWLGLELRCADWRERVLQQSACSAGR